jgi:hypothetical protein
MVTDRLGQLHRLGCDSVQVLHFESTKQPIMYNIEAIMAAGETYLDEPLNPHERHRQHS